MNKILPSLLGITLLLGPVQAMQEENGVFKLGVQAANALTLDENPTIEYAKKKSTKKSKKSKAGKKRGPSSEENTDK